MSLLIIVVDLGSLGTYSVDYDQGTTLYRYVHVAEIVTHSPEIIHRCQ